MTSQLLDETGNQAAVDEAESLVSWNFAGHEFSSVAETLRAGLAVRQMMTSGVSAGDYLTLLNLSTLKWGIRSFGRYDTHGELYFENIRKFILAQDPINPYTGKISAFFLYLQLIEKAKRNQQTIVPKPNELKALEATLKYMQVDSLATIAHDPKLDFQAQLFYRRQLFKDWDQKVPEPAQSLPSFAEVETVLGVRHMTLDLMLRNLEHLLSELRQYGITLKIRDLAGHEISPGMLVSYHPSFKVIVSYHNFEAGEFRIDWQDGPPVALRKLKTAVAFLPKAVFAIDLFHEAICWPMLVDNLRGALRTADDLELSASEEKRPVPLKTLKQALLYDFMGYNNTSLESGAYRLDQLLPLIDIAKTDSASLTVDLPQIYQDATKRYNARYKTTTPEWIVTAAKKYDHSYQNSFRSWNLSKLRSGLPNEFAWLKYLRERLQQQSTTKLAAPLQSGQLILSTKDSPTLVDIDVRFRGEQPNTFRIPNQEDCVGLQAFPLTPQGGTYSLEYEGGSLIYREQYVGLYLPPFAVPDSVIVKYADGETERLQQIAKNYRTDTFFIDLGGRAAANQNISYQIDYHYESATDILPKSISPQDLHTIITRLENLGERKLSGWLMQQFERGASLTYRDLESSLQRYTLYQIAAPEDIDANFSFEVLEKLVNDGQFRMPCSASACALTLLMRETALPGSVEVHPIGVYDRFSRQLHAQVGVFRGGLKDIYDATGSISSVKSLAQSLIIPVAKFWLNLQSYFNRIRGQKQLSDLAILQEHNKGLKLGERSTSPPQQLRQGPTELKQEMRANPGIAEFLTRRDLSQNLIIKQYQILSAVERWQSRSTNDTQLVAELASFKIWNTTPQNLGEALLAAAAYQQKMADTLSQVESQPARLVGHDYLAHANASTRQALMSIYREGAKTFADLSRGDRNACTTAAASPQR